jgi:superfamily I DNA/RNA helicase
MVSEVEKELARGTPPDRIGYVSFTRRAAQEAIDRACARFKLQKTDFPYFSTVHSLCFRQLGLKRGDVLEGVKMKDFARFAGVRISGRLSEDGTWAGYDDGDRILFMENLARIRGVPLRDAYDRFGDDDLPWAKVQVVTAALREFKRARGLMDFTDMLLEFVRSGIQVKLDFLGVDEAQDLSWAQWRVVDSVAQHSRRQVVAGDDDQAIYRWAGADADHLILMAGDVEVLGQSWRVPRSVQRVALGIVPHIGRRRDKPWVARAGGDGAVEQTPHVQNVDFGTGNVLVLTRNVYILTEQIEPWLRQQGIVYERNGRSSIPAGLLDVIQDWEALRGGAGRTASAVRRVFESMTAGRGYRRGFGRLPGREDDEIVSKDELLREGTLLTGQPWFDALDKLPKQDTEYVRAARARGEKITAKPRVTISTIHGSKGGEADHVVLLTEMAARTYREMRSAPQDEARVWYVGATRAREKLTIVRSSTERRCPWL